MRINEATEIDVDFSGLKIDNGEIYSFIGYRDRIPNDYETELIESMLHEASAVCRPRFGFVIVDGAVDGRSLQLGSKHFIPGAIIANKLRLGNKFAVVIATVGTAMDEWIRDYTRGADIMKTFVADALGSIFVEAVVAFGASGLERIANASGLNSTNSYSPGYCGWNIAEQHQLFELLPVGFCGVTLLESSLMLPIKSVSSVIGLGVEVRKEMYGCSICRKKDCFKRNISKFDTNKQNRQ